MVHLKMFAQPKLNYVFYIFFISFIGIITTEASEFPYFCDLKISYYPGEDGQAYEVFHREPNKIRAKTKIFHGEHPSHGSFKQLGVTWSQQEYAHLGFQQSYIKIKSYQRAK